MVNAAPKANAEVWSFKAKAKAIIIWPQGQGLASRKYSINIDLPSSAN